LAVVAARTYEQMFGAEEQDPQRGAKLLKKREIRSRPASRTSVWFMALLYFNLQRWLLAVLFDEVARVD
jgi:hypothetical protein